jgi:uncharacterized membrane protein YeaQ/YmgE (transglycosylase-associated protein family)
MGIIATIVVGLIVGLLAHYIMRTSTGLLVDIILGIIGGFVGGWLSSLFFGVNLMTGINITSIIVALIGAIIVIAIYRVIRREPVR